MDGLIVSLCDETARARSSAWAGSPSPTVILDRDVAVGSDHVLSEHLRPMKMAVEHLFAQGHRRSA